MSDVATIARIAAGAAIAQADRHEKDLGELRATVKAGPFDDAHPSRPRSLEARMAELEHRLAAAGIP